MNTVSNKYDDVIQAAILAARKATNPIVIYHAGCVDGFAAAWCFHKMSKETKDSWGYTYHPGVYGEIPPDCTDRMVYLVDFSYKREVIVDMLNSGATIWLIDHHKTALEDLAGLEKEYFGFRGYTDLSRSGAMLAWDFLNNIEFDDAGEIEREVKLGDIEYTEPPTTLAAIQDRDLWKFLLPHTKEINAALFSYEFDFEIWDKLMSPEPAEFLRLCNDGIAIGRKHRKDIGTLLPLVQRMVAIGGNCVPVANMPHMYASDAGNIMAREFNKGNSFAATYFDTATQRTFSLRSTVEGKDVSLIAKQYGGGGHKNAAGFSVPRNHPLAQF